MKLSKIVVFYVKIYCKLPIYVEGAKCQQLSNANEINLARTAAIVKQPAIVGQLERWCLCDNHTKMSLFKIRLD